MIVKLKQIKPFCEHIGGAVFEPYQVFMADMCLFDICGLWCVVHWQQQQCLMGGFRVI